MARYATARLDDLEDDPVRAREIVADGLRVHPDSPSLHELARLLDAGR